VSPKDLHTLSPNQLLVVIDGSSYLFRAFYAPHLNKLTAPGGAPSGAIYGVLTMLQRLEKLLPIHQQGGINAGGQSISACFVMDEKGGSFRNQLYPEYKANRQAPPESLVAQIEPLKNIIRALGWPLLSKVGMEADDLIATLVAHAKAEGKYSVIVTGDKDLAQLVDDHCFILDTMKDEWLDAEGVARKFGVSPTQIIDYLTLIGDTSDNVPGVNKVGPKTAVKWLSEWGYLDAIVANAPTMSGAVGEHLREALSWLPLSKQLITLIHDVPLPEDFSPTFQPMQTQAVRDFYTQWGFKRLLADLDKTSPSLAPPAPSTDINTTVSNDSHTDLFGNALSPLPSHPATPADSLPRLDPSSFVCINHPRALTAWLDKARGASMLAIDTETTGLNPHLADLVGISLAYDGNNACYLPLGHLQPDRPQLTLAEVVEHLAPLLADPTQAKCGHNLRFDRILLARHGMHLGGELHDTALASFTLNPTDRHSLEAVAHRWLGLGGISFDTLIAQSTVKKNIAGVSIVATTIYTCEDAALTWRCAAHAKTLLTNQPRLSTVYALECQVSEVLFGMEKKWYSHRGANPQRLRHRARSTVPNLGESRPGLGRGAL
jgi:DNA polymerase-1